MANHSTPTHHETVPERSHVQPGTSIGGASIELHDIITEHIRSGPAMISTLGDQYGIYRPVVVPPGGRLPAKASDGQTATCVVDPVNGIVWSFRYRQGAPLPYAWEFTGGSTVRDVIAANESTSSGTYTNLATVGPTVTLPFSGDYRVRFSCQPNGFGSASTAAVMGIFDGATGPIDIALTGLTGSASANITLGQAITVTGANAGDILTAKYYITGGAGPVSFANRWMEALPVRVSGG